MTPYLIVAAPYNFKIQLWISESDLITSKLDGISNAIAELKRMMVSNTEDIQTIRAILDSCPICELDGGEQNLFLLSCSHWCKVHAYSFIRFYIRFQIVKILLQPTFPTFHNWTDITSSVQFKSSNLYKKLLFLCRWWRIWQPQGNTGQAKIPWKNNYNCRNSSISASVCHMRRRTLLSWGGLHTHPYRLSVWSMSSGHDWRWYRMYSSHHMFWWSMLPRPKSRMYRYW